MFATVSQSYRVAGTALALLALSSGLPRAAAEIRDLPVPAATILPNTVITGKQIRARSFKVTATSIAGFATEASEIVGKQSRRRLFAGKPVPLSALAMPFTVRRGAVVAAVFQDNGFSIATSLVALQDGAEGDVIEARNAATGIIVLAKVKPDGTLEVDGP